MVFNCIMLSFPPFLLFSLKLCILLLKSMHLYRPTTLYPMQTLVHLTQMKNRKQELGQQQQW